MPTKPAMMITFVKERETKNTIRYSEVSPGGIVNTQYINTMSLRQVFGNIPDRITIEIKEG